MSLEAAIDAADDVLVNHFFPAFGLEVARELRESGENALASDVTSAVLEKDFARAEAIVERLYAELLRSEGSWTSTAHRECYVLAQLRTCVERLRGRGNAEDGRAATRALDMCVILGAPADALRAFVNACELKLGIRAIRGAYERRVECGWTFPRESPEPPAMGERRWLERVDAKGLTAKEFRCEYFKVDRPVGLVGLGADWPAMRKWDDLRWWSAFHGHRSVPLELGAYDDEGNWRETVKTMHEFVMEDLQPSVSGRSNAVAYLAQHRLVDHLQSLSSDFTVPEFCAKSLERINVWMGTAGTVTPCHFDTYDNLLGQVRSSTRLTFCIIRELIVKPAHERRRGVGDTTSQQQNRATIEPTILSHDRRPTHRSTYTRMYSHRHSPRTLFLIAGGRVQTRPTVSRVGHSVHVPLLIRAGIGTSRPRELQRCRCGATRSRSLPRICQRHPVRRPPRSR